MIIKVFRCSNFEATLRDRLLSTDLTQIMYLFAQNRMQKYLGAVTARPRAGFARDIMVGGANLVLTRVVTAPKCPLRYVIDILCIDNVDAIVARARRQRTKLKFDAG